MNTLTKTAALAALNKSTYVIQGVELTPGVWITREGEEGYLLFEYGGASGEGMGFTSHKYEYKRGSFSECYKHFKNR